MFLDGLNSNQEKAVLFPPNGRLQIIAGPGTGKTKVLVSRVAYLLIQCKIPPNQIIVTTFTKKAANEMVERLTKIIKSECPDNSIDLSKLIIGTFHSICYRIINTYGRLINKNGFKIADERDSSQIMNETIEKCDTDGASDKFGDKNVDPFRKNDPNNSSNGSSSIDPRKIKRQISKAKSKALDPAEYHASPKSNPFISYIYREYQERLEAHQLLDFDDCLLTCYDLIRSHTILTHIKHVLVDEFQDTNELQLNIMYELAKHCSNVTIVGDPDQSIYGFRDAQVENFSKMASHYQAQGISIVQLDQNYRSTSDILEFSEHVMRNQSSEGRHSKELKSQQDSSFPPCYCNLSSQEKEAEWICFQIEQLKKLPGSPILNKDISILFRSSFQTRIMENELVRRKIPYFMVRGKAFWDRKEVVSVLDYLRVIANPNDRIAYLRTINFPKRGMGPKSIQEIDEYISRRNEKQESNRLVSVFDCLVEIAQGGSNCKLTKSNLQNLLKYTSIVQEGRDMLASSDLELGKLFDHIYEKSGLRSEFSQDANQELNTLEVRRQLEEYIPIDDKLHVDEILDSEEPDLNIIERFVQSIGLYESNSNDKDDSADGKQGKVNLSTIHGSKGLEWPVVFVPGLSEGLVPAKFAIDAGGEMDEERRCFYVATTRAKALLYISSFTESRERWGRMPINETSRFLKGNGIKGKLSGQQRAFENEKNLQSLYKVVNHPWVDDSSFNFEAFKTECSWEDEDNKDKENSWSRKSLKGMDFNSMGFETARKTNSDEKAVSNGERSFSGERKQGMASDNSAAKRSKIDRYLQPKLSFKASFKAPAQLHKTPAVKAANVSTPTSSVNASRAPAYIPVRRVPSSLSRVKKLHDFKKDSA